MVRLNDKMCNVIYFDDIDSGLLAVIWSLSPPETKFIRFSSRPIPRNLTPSVN